MSLKRFFACSDKRARLCACRPHRTRTCSPCCGGFCRAAFITIFFTGLCLRSVPGGWWEEEKAVTAISGPAPRRAAIRRPGRAERNHAPTLLEIGAKKYAKGEYQPPLSIILSG